MLRAAVKLSIVITWCALMAVVVIACGPATTSADEKANPADVPSANIELKVTAVRVGSGRLDSLNGNLALRVRFTNRSGRPLKLANSQFTCTVDSRPCDLKLGGSDSLLTRDTSVPSDQSRDGWLAFEVKHTGTSEPEIQLKWSPGKEKDTGETNMVSPVSVNEAVRRQANIRSQRIGPHNSAAVVEIHRTIDFLSIGPLTEELGRLKQKNARRVVLDLQGDDSAASMSSAGYGWLASVRIGGDASRFPVRQQISSAVQFDEFYVAGLKSSSSYRMRAPGLFYASRAEAVAAAIRPLYEQVPLQQALADLNHPEDGIRQAVLESNIDRLNAAELSMVIAESREHGEDDLSLVAENLHRVALSGVITYLNELIRDDRTKVSAAALRSLVQSVSPGARGAVRTYWRETKDDPELRQRIITELMRVKDRRYPDLIAEYTEYQLMAYSNASEDHALTETSTAAPTPAAPQRAVTPADRETMKALLHLLQAQKNSSFVHAARRELLDISDPGLQDLVAEFVLTAGQPADAELIRQYILQRLPAAVPSADGLTEEQQARLVQRYGPPGVAVKTRFTKQLMATIRMHPESSYTERLLELSQSKANTGTMRGETFRTAIACATDRQLRDVVERFASLDHKQKSYLLKQYSTRKDSRWLSLARQTLTSDPSALVETVNLLRTDGSPEALQVLIDHLEEVRTAAEAATTIAPKDLKTTMQLLVTINASSYPAARRSFNRCVTSSVKQIAELTHRTLAASRAIPDRQHRAQIQVAQKLTQEGKYPDALEKLNSILIDYPWSYSAYISRASLHLRNGAPELAIMDLKEADRLSPEDPLIQSLTALTDVRLGRPAAGIAAAEEVLRSVPDLPTFIRRWTIYNTACVYGRAVEREQAGARKDELTRRAMELLRAAAVRDDGIDDVDHVQNDPDLSMFHQHPEWQNFVDIVTRNTQKNSQLKP